MLRCFHYKHKTKDEMNNHTIEPAGALPSYDVKDLVVFIPEDGEGREIVCEVTGYQDTNGELLYQLKGSLTGQQYLSDFACLAPHIEDDPDDPDDLMRHDYGEAEAFVFDPDFQLMCDR